MSKLIIVVAGKRQSGKNTISNEIAAAYLNWRGHEGDYWVDAHGQLQSALRLKAVSLEQGVGNERDISLAGVRIMAFASLLKKVCIEVLGLTHEQVYGTNAAKETFTNLCWQDLPWGIRFKHRLSFRKFWQLRRGNMTAREVMQIFGTDLIRRWNPDAWVSAAYKQAGACSEELCIICDGRFPNEVTEGDWRVEQPVLNVRCLRAVHQDRHESERALDGMGVWWFDLVIPEYADQEMQREIVEEWFKRECIPLLKEIRAQKSEVAAATANKADV